MFEPTKIPDPVVGGMSLGGVEVAGTSRGVRKLAGADALREIGGKARYWNFDDKGGSGNGRGAVIPTKEEIGAPYLVVKGVVG